MITHLGSLDLGAAPMPSMLHLHHSPHQTSIVLPLAALLLAGLLELLARYGR